MDIGSGITSHTAPGWEERSYCLAPAARRGGLGCEEPVRPRPGFQRLVVVTSTDAPPGLEAVLQHSADGTRWFDLAPLGADPEAQGGVLWIEAPGSGAGATPYPGRFCPERVLPHLRVRWAAEPGVEALLLVSAVAIYRVEAESSGVTPRAAAAGTGSEARPAAAGGRTR